MAIFKRKHLQLILEGRKTQSRRTHKGTWKLGKTYALRTRWFEKAGPERIVITRKFRQRLGEISAEDVRNEGFENLADFKRAWEEIHGPGSWDPARIVMVYKFKLVRASARASKLSSASESRRYLFNYCFLA